MNKIGRKLEAKKAKSNFKLGDVLLYRHAWRLSFKCNICHEELAHMKDFLIHSLEHLYDIDDDAVNCLLDSATKDEAMHIELDTNEETANTMLDNFENEQEQQCLDEDEANSVECIDSVVNYEDDSADVGKALMCYKKLEPIEANVGETVLTDIIAEEYLDEDGSGFEREFLDIQPIKPQILGAQNCLQTKENGPSSMDPSNANAKLPKKEFVCSRCKKSFLTKEGLYNHIKRHTAVHACDMCNAVFNDHGNLRVHRFRHLGIQPHSCKVCNKRFTTTTEVKLHMRTHTGEKPYVCEECGMSFVSSSGYHIHKRRTHQKLRPLQCELCERRFLTRMELEDHVRLHKNEKPLKCPECGEGFKTNRTLLRHKKKHLTDLIYKCKYCDKEYTHNIGLYWHIKREHNNETT